MIECNLLGQLGTRALPWSALLLSNQAISV